MCPPSRVRAEVQAVLPCARGRVLRTCDPRGPPIHVWRLEFFWLTESPPKDGEGLAGWQGVFDVPTGNGFRSMRRRRRAARSTAGAGESAGWRGRPPPGRQGAFGVELKSAGTHVANLAGGGFHRVWLKRHRRPSWVLELEAQELLPPGCDGPEKRLRAAPSGVATTFAPLITFPRPQTPRRDGDRGRGAVRLAAIRAPIANFSLKPA